MSQMYNFEVNNVTIVTTNLMRRHFQEKIIIKDVDLGLYLFCLWFSPLFIFYLCFL